MNLIQSLHSDNCLWMFSPLRLASASREPFLNQTYLSLLPLNSMALDLRKFLIVLKCQQNMEKHQSVQVHDIYWVELSSWGQELACTSWYFLDRHAQLVHSGAQWGYDELQNSAWKQRLINCPYASFDVGSSLQSYWSLKKLVLMSKKLEHNNNNKKKTNKQFQVHSYAYFLAMNLHFDRIDYLVLCS